MKTAVKFFVLALVVACVAVHLTEAAPEKSESSFRPVARGQRDGSNCATKEADLSKCEEKLSQCNKQTCAASCDNCRTTLETIKGESDKCAREIKGLSDASEAQKSDCEERKNQAQLKADEDVSNQATQFAKEISVVQAKIDAEDKRIQDEEEEYNKKSNTLDEECKNRKQKAALSQELCLDMCITLQCDVDHSYNIFSSSYGYSFDPKSVKDAMKYECPSKQRRGKGGGNDCGELPKELSQCESDLNECHNKCACDKCTEELKELEDTLEGCREEKKKLLQDSDIQKRECKKAIEDIEKIGAQKMGAASEAHQGTIGELNNTLNEKQDKAAEQAAANNAKLEKQKQECDAHVNTIESENSKRCLETCAKKECDEEGTATVEECVKELGNVGDNDTLGLKLWCLNNAGKTGDCEELNKTYCKEHPYFYSPFGDREKGLKCDK
eukprot:Nk52_evm1s1951 gene=Nk52_evmTU1s1951